jgi:pimeloyl-ACP methyl ester carboxylesterase
MDYWEWEEIAMLKPGVCQPVRYLPIVVLCLAVSLTVSATPSRFFAKAPAVAAAAADSVASKDGVNIVYTVEGDGQPALVFVHGWAGNKSFWQPQLDELKKKYKVVALDLAGHGESGKGREFYTVEAYAGDVAAVVEKLNLDRVVLIGHSEGGRICVRAARVLGDRVIGLIGVDSLQDLNVTYTADQLDRALKPFKDDFKGTTTAFVKTLFPEKADPALVARVASEMAAVLPAVGLSSLRSEALYNVKADLVGLRLPIRVINSERFPTILAENKAIYRNYEMIPVPGVGHFPMLEDPARFNQLLGGVIADIEAKKTP